MSAAVRAAEAGLRVIVVAPSLGDGAPPASMRSGGHVLRGYALSAADLIERLGRDDAAEAFDFTTRAVRAMLDDGATTTGSYLLHDERAGGRLEDELEAVVALSGAGIEAVSGADAERRCGARATRGGFFDPVSGFVAAEAWLDRLLRRAAAAGVELRQGAVGALKEEGDGVHATLKDDARVVARRVLAAAGGATGSLAPKIGGMTPLRTTLHVFTFDADPLELPSICIESGAPEYVWATNNELRYGVRADPQPDHLELSALLERRFGSLSTRLVVARSDLIWAPRNLMPSLTAEGAIWGLTGFEGHGVALAHSLGGLCGAAAAEEGSAIEELRRFAELFGRG